MRDQERKNEAGVQATERRDSLIKQNGYRYGVDPYLVFLVIEKESQFNSQLYLPKAHRD